MELAVAMQGLRQALGGAVGEPSVTRLTRNMAAQVALAWRTLHPGVCYTSLMSIWAMAIHQCCIQARKVSGWDLWRQLRATHQAKALSPAARASGQWSHQSLPSQSGAAFTRPVQYPNRVKQAGNQALRPPRLTVGASTLLTSRLCRQAAAPAMGWRPNRSGSRRGSLSKSQPPPPHPRARRRHQSHRANHTSAAALEQAV